MALNFALDNPWMIVISLTVAILVTLSVVLVLTKIKVVPKRTKLASNLGRFTETPEYKKLIKSYRMGVIFTVVILIGALMTSMVLSAKPVTVESTTPTKYNRDIVLCLDISGSMLNVDTNILETFETILEDFKGERISLVIWNSSSASMFPLTDDYEYVKQQIKLLKDSINPTYYETNIPYDYSRYTLNSEGGSLIGDGLTACSLSFDDDDASEERSKSIILATDNIVNGEQIIQLPEAADYAIENGIKVYGIRPTTGYEVGGEEEAMKTAVESTGGIFYTLENPVAVKGIVESISAEEAGAIKGDTVITKTDTPAIWIFGLSLLSIISFGLMWRFKV